MNLVDTRLICDLCGGPILKDPQSGATGYGVPTEAPHLRYCFACCAQRDRADMAATGRAVLYLTVATRVRGAGLRVTGWHVTNWPGSLDLNVRCVQSGRHNIARKRRDVWFDGPDGYVWHGTQYGENTDLVHCKRTKHRSDSAAIGSDGRPR